MHPDYSLTELASLTGFSIRQIRYYITRKLVPGSDERGPNARYSQDALDRLKRIKELKDHALPPSGRTPTLDEIGTFLDEGTPNQEREITVSSPLKTRFFRTASRERQSFTLDSSPREMFPGSEDDLTPLRPLLEPLRDLLAEMTENSNPDELDTETWCRVRTPDMEIHVRQPSDSARRTRLSRVLRALDSLLDRRI